VEAAQPEEVSGLPGRGVPTGVSSPSRGDSLAGSPEQVRSQEEIDTKGHCCLNPFFAYVGVTDAAVRLLVGNGMQGPHKI
jgi:hypothetical protein